MVTPELSPYARGTRASDTVAALAKALCQLEHRVTVATPRHPGFEAGGLLAARRLTPLPLADGSPVTVLDGQLPTGATAALFDAPGLFDRPGVYGEVEEYPDNAERFALLCAAATALVQQRAERGEPFDVVHLHDWPAAAMARTLASRVPGPASVLSIHDATRRGVVSAADAARFGISSGPDAEAAREDAGVSLLAAGARAADAVTASSPTAAADLLDPARFGVLARVLSGRATPASGILGGLDYAIWNPATDPALKARYDAEDASNKGSSKTDLVRKAGIEVDLARPLVAAIVDTSDAGSIELLERAAERLLSNDISLFVVARGAADPTPRFQKLVDRFGGRFAIERTEDDVLVRRASAAADLVLLPATHEASATWARGAQRYGALPVARALGANLDAIVDCDAALETGTGFLYDEPTPEAVQGALARGLSAYVSARWASLRRRVMRLDLAWDRPARRYVQVYKQAILSRSKG